MNPQDQRMSCIRMAIDMGCKPDAVVSMAKSLMTLSRPAPCQATRDATTAEAVVETVVTKEEVLEAASQSVVAEAVAETAATKD